MMVVTAKNQDNNENMEIIGGHKLEKNNMKMERLKL